LLPRDSFVITEQSVNFEKLDKTERGVKNFLDLLNVIPVTTGIQTFASKWNYWMPASAGMTKVP